MTDLLQILHQHLRELGYKTNLHPIIQAINITNKQTSIFLTIQDTTIVLVSLSTSVLSIRRRVEPLFCRFDEQSTTIYHYDINDPNSLQKLEKDIQTLQEYSWKHPTI